MQSNPTLAREPDQPLRAVGWMALSALGFSIMSVLVKRHAELPQFELVFFRSFVNFVMQLFFVMALGQSIFPSTDKKILVFRGLAGFFSLSCFIYALQALPVSIAAMINWCSPVFVIVFSWIALRERIERVVLAWIGLIFVGVFLLVRPAGGAGLPLTAVLITILGAAFGGMAYVAVRAATARVGVHVIILYFTGISSLLSLPLALRDFQVPTPAHLAELILLGLFATLGQYAMTQGYRYAKAGLVSTMGLMNTALTAFWGWLVFSERLAWAQWAGMVLIGIGISVITLRNQSLPKVVH